MKWLDRLINFIFSLVILVISVVVLLALFNYIDYTYVNSLINDYLWGADYRLIVIITTCIVLLAALKTTIFLSDFKKKRKIPILVSTENGVIQIASETIESTAKAVAISHEEVRDVNVKMVNKNKGVDVYMSLLVIQDTNIRTITKQIQDEVKEKVHETTGVLVLNTDIKVKNIIEKSKKTMVVNELAKEKVEKEVETKQQETKKEETKEEDISKEEVSEKSIDEIADSQEKLDSEEKSE